MRLSLRKPHCFLLFMSVILGFSASAQFGNLVGAGVSMTHRYSNAKYSGKNTMGYLGYSLGGGISSTSATFEHSYQEVLNETSVIEERFIKKTPVKATQIHASVYTPLASLSENSTIAFNLGVDIYVLDYDLGMVKFEKSPFFYDYSLNAIQFGLPLTIDYMYGGEATFDKTKRMSFNFGLGLMPMFYGNTFGMDKKAQGGIRPFVRTELGFFAGIEWKIRASCVMGTVNTMTLTSEHPGMETFPENSIVTLRSKPIYSIGIAIMPFSFDWSNYGF